MYKPSREIFGEDGHRADLIDCTRLEALPVTNAPSTNIPWPWVFEITTSLTFTSHAPATRTPAP
ncbi:hypothetical protein J2Y45_003236 [Dyadobacter sp. BE34]|uniref:Uncharacterized protein n=1 Tax=Dyadobacter fermentans TaxID=94254 RepID=A0ABU1QY04_9BACT|nr:MULTISPECIES: hypothetical protein [Dyadobacter]MDR6806044.1 hypothetical protein [Dyadobacter fermentans]MDR7043785.1 hypothetical protein [Dyadobacter sp. BE242]MDR7198096.1 hypothetical protein [Dyadobacter sp. BE34]MDR7216059.1 hypothetical protein [Dyadobacter sp. BE31]MDR7264415.1 hypothetical protein [Dyadobacter sp. BE32]